MGQYSQAKRSAFKRLKDKLSWGGEKIIRLLEINGTICYTNFKINGLIINWTDLF